MFSSGTWVASSAISPQHLMNLKPPTQYTTTNYRRKPTTRRPAVMERQPREGTEKQW